MQWNAQPELATVISNLDDYDVIFLGYPIWWNEAPAMIATFLSENDFSGKVIAPFCTSSYSPIDKSLHIFQDLTSGAVIADGLTRQLPVRYPALGRYRNRPGGALSRSSLAGSVLGSLNSPPTGTESPLFPTETAGFLDEAERAQSCLCPESRPSLLPYSCPCATGITASP